MTNQTIYIIRDIDTEGCDFLLWGKNPEQAAVSFLDFLDNPDLDLIAVQANELDEHTQDLIGGQS